MFVGFRHTLAAARAEANTLAAKELETLGIPAPDNFDQYLVMRKQLNRYLAPADLQWLSKQDSLIRAQLSTDDFRAYQEGFQTMTGLTSTVFSMDVPALRFKFAVPVFLVQGTEDHITDASISARYFQNIQAPIKRLTLVEGAGHFAQATHMERVVDAIREDLSLLSPLKK